MHTYHYVLGIGDALPLTSQYYFVYKSCSPSEELIGFQTPSGQYALCKNESWSFSLPTLEGRIQLKNIHDKNLDISLVVQASFLNQTPDNHPNNHSE